MKIINLKVNEMYDPIGISDKEILFSWEIKTNEYRVKQRRFELQVSFDSEFKTIIWSQNEVSDQSVNVKYKGPRLMEKTSFFSRVRIITNNDVKTDWSEVQTFETGILNPSSWVAKWVTTKHKQINEFDASLKPFSGKKQFEISRPIKKARLYISALGVYSAYLNGKKIGKDYLTPGWTDYNNCVQYQTYDLSDDLKENNNLVITVAEGWYSGYLGWEKKKNTYGNFNAFIAQLEVTYLDGTVELIKSDRNWHEVDNIWKKSDLYNGEIQDLNVQQDRLSNLRELSITSENLVAQMNEPIRKQNVIKPIALFRDNLDQLILDMGQNMVGWINCKIKGVKGQIVSLTHGEVLDREGNFYRENIRDAQQLDKYVLTGNIDELEPNFTFHGFRYVHLENFPDSIKIDDFSGVVLHSDLIGAGTFESSNQLLNQLQSNILWSQKGNFLDVPTDCPQRDERLGWTADAQMFLPTACFNMNTLNFFKKWLRDMRYAQHDSGEIPYVVPDVLKGVFDYNISSTTAAWGDAATIIPWKLYEIYDDVSVLKDNYLMMKSWVDYIRNQGEYEELWDTGIQLGDWLALDAHEGSLFGATDETLLATCYFAYSAEILAKTARVLNKYDDFNIYISLHRKIKDKILKDFFSPDGKLKSNTQTAHIIILMFKLHPQELEKSLVSNLEKLISSKGNHLDSGFIGTPYVCQVLSEFEKDELAYRLLFNEDEPSWLYQVINGATTVWEHFDSIKSDGSFWDKSMNSFNHYVYGSIGNWMYENIGGIQLKKPGFKESIIHPKLTNSLSYAKTTRKTPYGQIQTSWRIENNIFSIEFSIPANTESEIILPKVKNEKVVLDLINDSWTPLRIGGKEGFDFIDTGVSKIKLNQEDGKKINLRANELLILVGSGNYKISYELTDFN